MDRTQAKQKNGRSQRGASIAIALLLLLVCALLTSIVLAATSAVTGRHVKLGERDQHYYSATSAAKLLTDELAGQEVLFDCSQIVTTKQKVSYDINGVVQSSAPYSDAETKTTYALTRTGSTTPISDNTPWNQATGTPAKSAFTFPERIALQFLTQADAVNAQDVWEHLAGQSTIPASLNPVVYNLEVTVDGSEEVKGADGTTLQNALKATVNQELDPKDGTVSLTITSGNLNETGYALKAICPADIDVEKNESEEFSEGGQTVSGDTFTRIETTKKITTFHVAMNWSVDEMINTEGNAA